MADVGTARQPARPHRRLPGMRHPGGRGASPSCPGQRTPPRARSWSRSTWPTTSDFTEGDTVDADDRHRRGRRRGRRRSSAVPSTCGRPRAGRTCSPRPTTFGVLFVTEDDARAWSGGPDNQALVLLTDEARGDRAEALDDLRGSAAVAAGATEVLDREQQPSNSLLQEDISGFEQMAVAFPALFLSAAALALYVLLTRRVTEERQIIGTMRAQRHARPDAGLALPVLRPGRRPGRAPCSGLPLGMAMAGAMSRPVRRRHRTAGAVARSQRLSGWRRCAVGIALRHRGHRDRGLLPVPAGRADPARRGDAGRGAARAGAAAAGSERVIPGLERAPARWRMIVRGIGRNKRRTVFTAAGVSDGADPGAGLRRDDRHDEQPHRACSSHAGLDGQRADRSTASRWASSSWPRSQWWTASMTWSRSSTSRSRSGTRARSTPRY